MTDFLGNPHKKPQNTLHVLKSINNKNNPYIIKMRPDSPHKQNLPMPLPIQRRIYQSSVNKGIMWPTVSPGTETRGKNLRKAKQKKNVAWT